MGFASRSTSRTLSVTHTHNTHTQHTTPNTTSPQQHPTPHLHNNTTTTHNNNNTTQQQHHVPRKRRENGLLRIVSPVTLSNYASFRWAWTTSAEEGVGPLRTPAEVSTFLIDNFLKVFWVVPHFRVRRLRKAPPGVPDRELVRPL